MSRAMMVDIPHLKVRLTGPSILPTDISTIAVLHGGSTAVADDIAAARLIVEHPIDKATAI